MRIRDAVETAGTGRWARASLAPIGALAVALGLAVGGPSADAPGAEASPRLLLDGPGWRVQDASEEQGREGLRGSVEFVTGKPVPYETIRIGGDAKRESESGMLPPATRQRRVELSWNLAASPKRSKRSATPSTRTARRGSNCRRRGRPRRSTRRPSSSPTRAAPATAR